MYHFARRQNGTSFYAQPMQWKYAAAATHGRGASRREGRSPARLLLHVQLKNKLSRYSMSKIKIVDK